MVAEEVARAIATATAEAAAAAAVGKLIEAVETVAPSNSRGSSWVNSRGNTQGSNRQ